VFYANNHDDDRGKRGKALFLLLRLRQHTASILIFTDVTRHDPTHTYASFRTAKVVVKTFLPIQKEKLLKELGPPPNNLFIDTHTAAAAAAAAVVK
jgi:hypothetical protein